MDDVSFNDPACSFIAVVLLAIVTLWAICAARDHCSHPPKHEQPTSQEVSDVR